MSEPTERPEKPLALVPEKAPKPPKLNPTVEKLLAIFGQKGLKDSQGNPLTEATLPDALASMLDNLMRERSELLVTIKTLKKM